jgi:hypothetical protein
MTIQEESLGRKSTDFPANGTGFLQIAGKTLPRVKWNERRI